MSILGSAILHKRANLATTAAITTGKAAANAVLCSVASNRFGATGTTEKAAAVRVMLAEAAIRVAVAIRAQASKFPVDSNQNVDWSPAVGSKLVAESSLAAGWNQDADSK